MFKTRFATVAALAVALMLLLAASPASALIVFRFRQVGAHVHVTATGGSVSGPLSPMAPFHREPTVDFSDTGVYVYTGVGGTPTQLSAITITYDSGFDYSAVPVFDLPATSSSGSGSIITTSPAGVAFVDPFDIDTLCVYENLDLNDWFLGFTGILAEFTIDSTGDPGVLIIGDLPAEPSESTESDTPVCPVTGFASPGTTASPPTFSVDFVDSNVDIVVTIPVSPGRSVADDTPLVVGTTGDAACSLAPSSTACADSDTNNVLTYNVGYATLRACGPAPATIASDSGDTRFNFAANPSVAEIERLTLVATIAFTEITQYDRDPSEHEVLIQDTRTITQDMAFFVQTPTVITETLTTQVYDDHNVDLVITGQTVTLSNVNVASTGGTDDSVAMQAEVGLTLRLQSWAKVTSVVYHVSEAVPVASAIATGTAPASPPDLVAADGYSTHAIETVYTLAGSSATGCDMSGDYKLTITVGCVTPGAGCPLSAADAAETHDLSFTIATDDVCPITGGTASGFSVALATYYATQAGGDASSSPVGGVCELSSDVPTGAASGAFVDDHQICVLSTVTDGDLATTETYISKITSDKASDTSADLRQGVANTESAGTDHKIDVERIAASDVYDGVAFDQDGSTDPATLTVEVTVDFGGAKRRSLLPTETAAASTTVTVSKASTEAGGLGQAASSPTVVTGVAGTVVVAVVVVAVVMMAVVVAVAFVVVSRAHAVKISHAPSPSSSSSSSLSASASGEMENGEGDRSILSGSADGSGSSSFGSVSGYRSYSAVYSSSSASMV